MGRRRSHTPDPAPEPQPPAAGELPAVPVIHPASVFTKRTLMATLGLKEGTLPREIRLGRLKARKRGGRLYFLGADVLAWLEGGEVRRPAEADTNGWHKGAMT